MRTHTRTHTLSHTHINTRAGCASSERGGQAGTSARKKQDSTSAATEHPAIPEGFCPPPGGLVFQVCGCVCLCVIVCD